MDKPGSYPNVILQVCLDFPLVLENRVVPGVLSNRTTFSRCCQHREIEGVSWSPIPASNDTHSDNGGCYRALRELNAW
jgi:hypothetical protein